MTSTDIDTLRVQTFSDSLEMLLQQKGSKFGSLCRQEIGVAGAKSHRMLNQIDKVNASERTTRAEVIDNTTVLYDNRWVFWKMYHFDTIIDDIDLLQTNIAPEGQITASAIADLNRQVDTDFLTAFFGDSKTGESGGTTTTFDGNQVVAVTEGPGSATGLNIPKLRAAKKLLLEAEVDVDAERVYLGLSPKQHDELLALTQVISTDFNTRPVLGEDGMVRSFMGFELIISNLLPTDGSTYRRLPVWVPSGMGCATWKEISGDVRNLPGWKGNPTLVEAEMSKGFTRLEEKRVVEIKCAE